MRRTVVFIIVCSTIVASWVACRKSRQEEATRRQGGVTGVIGADAGAFDPPNTGTIGHNGLTPDEFWNHKSDLEAIMKNRLTLPPPDAGELNGTFASVLDAGSGSSKTLADYIISCTVPKGTVTSYKGSAYSADDAYVSSLPVLSGAGVWRTGGMIDKSQSEKDLYTCLAARFNPDPSDKVKIWIGGAPVTKTDSDSGFPISEAYWAAGYGSDSLVLYVWPQLALTTCARHKLAGGAVGGDDGITKILENIMYARVCGSGGLECHLDVHVAACSRGSGSDSGSYYCPDPADSTGTSSVSVIRTKLSCSTFCSLYPACSGQSFGDCSCPAVSPDGGVPR